MVINLWNQLEEETQSIETREEFKRKLKLIVEQISGKIWHNRGFNDKSVKTSKIVHLDLLNKIGYGPIA